MSSTTVGQSGAESLFLRHEAQLRRWRFLQSLLFVAIGLFLWLISARIADFDLAKIYNGIPRLGEFIQSMLPDIRRGHVTEDIQEWFFPWRIWMRLLWETILIAFLATVMGSIAAVLLGLAASRNLAANAPALFVARRLLEIARTIPELVYALIFVFCFGVGPLAGVLAIAIHTAGALGKLFSEVNENAQAGPLEGIQAAGGSWLQAIRLGLIPQVLPNYLSYGLLRFEINVRSSSIIGYVGAGGLGQEISTAIGLNSYTDLSALFLIIAATVIVIDLVGEKIRHRFTLKGLSRA